MREASPTTPCVVVIRTKAGRGLYEKDGRTHEIWQDMACVVISQGNGKFRRAPNITEQWEYEQISFAGEFSVQLWAQFQKEFGSVASLPKASPAELALTQLMRSSSQQNSFEQSKEAYGFLLAWWQQLSLSWRDFTDPIQAAIRFCEGERRLRVGVSELAEMAGMSREHFSRVFREKTGVTPAAFLRSRRLRQARELILRTDLPLGEVAARCGFASKHRLTRAYALAFGKLPPRNWPTPAIPT